MTSPTSMANRPLIPGSAAPREIIPQDPKRTFRALIHDFPSEVCGWAAHPEYEIHLIQKSTGSLIVGDYVGTFSPGHVSMMGPMLPHDWVSDITEGEIVTERDALVQFSDEWIRGCQVLMPELHIVDGLLTRSTRGIEFSGETARRAGAQILALINEEGSAHIARMFDLLHILASAPEHETTPLASQWIGTTDDALANSAVEAGLAYIFDNLTQDIRLSVAANLAHMSEPTFSKYFKRAAGATFSSMVKRLRIAHAQRLLDTTDLSMAKVARASGYRNLSNFNRQFLAETGMTPTHYRATDRPPVPPWPAHRI